MKATELRSKSDADLGKELNDLLKAQFSLRMQLATQQLNNTSEIQKVRRDIARVRTLIAEKAIGQIPVGEKAIAGKAVGGKAKKA
jgi:large subunit ribosomal protein L29